MAQLRRDYSTQNTLCQNTKVCDVRDEKIIKEEVKNNNKVKQNKELLALPANQKRSQSRTENRDSAELDVKNSKLIAYSMGFPTSSERDKYAG